MSIFAHKISRFRGLHGLFSYFMQRHYISRVHALIILPRLVCISRFILFKDCISFKMEEAMVELGDASKVIEILSSVKQIE